MFLLVTIISHQTASQHQSMCTISTSESRDYWGQAEMLRVETCLLLYPQVHQPYILSASSITRTGLQSNTLPLGRPATLASTELSLVDEQLPTDSWRQPRTNSTPAFDSYKTQAHFWLVTCWIMVFIFCEIHRKLYPWIAIEHEPTIDPLYPWGEKWPLCFLDSFDIYL